MAGFVGNKRSNHEIEKDTGYVRMGQGGKRHRFANAKSKPKVTPEPEPMMGDPDGDPSLDALTGEGPLDQDPLAGMPEPPAAPMQHPALPKAAPVTINIHLSPSDHKAFKGMASKKNRKKEIK